MVSIVHIARVTSALTSRRVAHMVSEQGVSFGLVPPRREDGPFDADRFRVRPGTPR
jgi:hypothetical protein